MTWDPSSLSFFDLVSTVVLTIIITVFAAYVSHRMGTAESIAESAQNQLNDLRANDHVHHKDFENLSREVEQYGNRLTRLEVYIELLRNHPNGSQRSGPHTPRPD